MIDVVIHTGDISIFYKAFVSVVKTKSIKGVSKLQIDKLFLDLYFVKCDNTMDDEGEKNRLFGFVSNADEDIHACIYKSPYHLAQNLQKIGLIDDPQTPTTDPINREFMSTIGVKACVIYSIRQIIQCLDISNYQKDNKDRIDLLKTYIEGSHFKNVAEIVAFAICSNILITTENELNVLFINLIYVLDDLLILLKEIQAQNKRNENHINRFYEIKIRIESAFNKIHLLIFL